MQTSNPLPNDANLAIARDVLLALDRLPTPWPTNNPLLAELVRFAARVVARERKQQRADGRERDADVRAETGIRSGSPASPAVPLPALARPSTCYVCKRQFNQLHHFYDSLCLECADWNFLRRHRTTDLRGRVALVTGGRVKAGYHVTLKLLRAGAEVVATTRFPKDAARRFAAEPDAEIWAGRLRLVGLDLRALAATEQFAAKMRSTLPHLDIFVANAAQTVRRPPAYYRSLVEAEREPLAALPTHAHEMVAHEASAAALATDGTLTTSHPGWPAELALLPLLPGDETASDHFPVGQLDQDQQQLDLRPENSWGLPQESVSTIELVEAHAINCLAPFLLLRELRPLFRAGAPRDRFAVMVSALEGQFAGEKTGRHPHTNMAKAALNMLVRTSAAEFAADRVFLTAVDPGWFSVQAAAPAAERFTTEGGRVPLDADDAASRILDPIFSGVESGQPASGVLFKDYRPVRW
ncbi:MAG: oxidoreductase [Planctomycetaceae bacterium]|nr:oxidoreductase [Planctomycetaceae bacterium]